jgi:hypothetical protein
MWIQSDVFKFKKNGLDRVSYKYTQDSAGLGIYSVHINGNVQVEEW